MEHAWDVVVVGANVAGASTSRELASRGLRVAMVDRLVGTAVGSRSCGDGIDRFQFEKLELTIPKGDFILREIKVGFVNSPDRKVRLRGESAGIAINRYGLNQHLLGKAVAAGVELLDATDVVCPVVEGGHVVGVRCRRKDVGEVMELRSSVTVDATGWRGQLRSSLPKDWPITEQVPRTEMAMAYREERRRSEPVDEMLVEATFDFDLAPRGLYWVADRTETLVNVGTGMQWVPGIPNPRRIVRQGVIPLYPGLEETEVIRAAGGIIPNRRPLDCPVGPGIIAVGDAACQVQPLSGSGIGASMYAAKLAGEAIARALEVTTRPGLEDLFPYAHGYHTTYGKDQAVNQSLRVSLQELTNQQMNRLMAARLVSEEEFVAVARRGRLDLSFGDKLKAATKLIGEPRLLRALSRMKSDMDGARELYSQYPESPSDLAAWRRMAFELFKDR